MCLKSFSIVCSYLKKISLAYLLASDKAVTSQSGLLLTLHKEHFKHKLENDFSYLVCSVLSHGDCIDSPEFLTCADSGDESSGGGKPVHGKIQ